MSKPITPAEASIAKAQSLPTAVFDCFNKRIAEAFDGRQSIVNQKQVAIDIADVAQVPSETVYDKHWLDVEDAYRAAGWKVTYDKPGFNEQGEATFVFEKPQESSR